MIPARSDSPSTSTSNLSRRSWTPASAIGSRIRTFTLCCSNLGALGVHVEGLRHRDAALDVGTEVGEAELDGAERGRDVEHVVVADVADAEDPALQLRLAVRELDAVAVAEQRDELRGVDPFGRADGGDDGGRVVVRREQLEPHRLRA